MEEVSKEFEDAIGKNNHDKREHGNVSTSSRKRPTSPSASEGGSPKKREITSTKSQDGFVYLPHGSCTSLVVCQYCCIMS